jgi:hypothetical protein
LTLSHDQVRSGAAGLFIFRTMNDRIIDEFRTTERFEGFGSQRQSQTQPISALLAGQLCNGRARRPDSPPEKIADFHKQYAAIINQSVVAHQSASIRIASHRLSRYRNT